MQHIIHSQVIGHYPHTFRPTTWIPEEKIQLVLTFQDLVAGLEEFEQIDAVLLYFSKAFDKVLLERLAIKRYHYGIRGNILNGYRAFSPTEINRLWSKDAYQLLLW